MKAYNVFSSCSQHHARRSAVRIGSMVSKKSMVGLSFSCKSNARPACFRSRMNQKIIFFIRIDFQACCWRIRPNPHLPTRVHNVTRSGAIRPLPRSRDIGGAFPAERAEQENIACCTGGEVCFCSGVDGGVCFCGEVAIISGVGIHLCFCELGIIIIDAVSKVSRYASEF